MSDLRLLNLRQLRRGNRRPMAFDLPADAVRIDRGSPWGNPFKMMGESQRAYVIELYRHFLRERLRQDSTILRPLEGKRLACWCAPLACHGDVILEVLDAPSIDEWIDPHGTFIDVLPDGSSKVVDVRGEPLRKGTEAH